MAGRTRYGDLDCRSAFINNTINEFDDEISRIYCHDQILSIKRICIRIIIVHHIINAPEWLPACRSAIHIFGGKAQVRTGAPSSAITTGDLPGYHDR